MLELGPNPVLVRMARGWVGPERVAAWCASLDQQAGFSDSTAFAAATEALVAADADSIEVPLNAKPQYEPLGMPLMFPLGAPDLLDR